MGYNEEHKQKILRIWSILNNPYCISDQRTLHSLEKVADAETYSSIVKQSIYLDEIKNSNEVGELISLNQKKLLLFNSLLVQLEILKV